MKKLLLLLFILLPLLLHAQKQGQPLVDSLLSELHKTKEDTGKVILLNNLSFNSNYTDPDKGIAYALEAIKLATMLDYDNGLASAYSSLSVNYVTKSDYRNAIEYCNRSLKIAEAIGNKKYIAVNFGNLATCFQGQGNTTKALEYLLKELKIAEEIGDKKLVAGCYSEIGNNYVLTSDPRKALEYFESALKESQLLNDKAKIDDCMLNIAGIYTLEKNYAKALEYYNNALEVSEKQGNKVDLQILSLDICITYRDLGNYTKSLEFGFKALQLAENLTDNGSTAEALIEIAATYVQVASDTTGHIVRGDDIPATREENIKKAIYYLDLGAAKAKSVSDPNLLTELYTNYTAAYRLAGRYKEALESYTTVVKLNDSLSSTDNRIKIANMGTELETNLKDKQIEINKIQEKKKHNERIFYIVFISLLIALVIFVLRNYRKQSLSNEQLAKEKTKSDILAQDLRYSIQQKDEFAAQLAASAETKAEFMANISHELRTPTTLLSGMLEILLNKRVAEKKEDQEKLEIAYRNSRKLQNMVQELLDLSKLENDNSITRYKYEVKDIIPILDGIVSNFVVMAEKEKLSLVYENNLTEAAYLNIDEQIFEKIINNLVYNAVKFNKTGGTITVKTALCEDRKKVTIVVADSGIGIDAHELPRIFDRFYQGNTDSQARGVGIGLSLVKEFTLLLGGNVDVASKKGIGTTFALSFPVTTCVENGTINNDETIPAPIENWGRFSVAQKVLIVEDNIEMRYYLKEILGEKVDISEAANGNEAIKWLQNNIADLIITDMMMPEMNGRELIARLKSSETTKKMPVIMLTAVADAESQLGVLRMGVEDYIVKPFNADELRIRVYNLLCNAEERRTFNQQPIEQEDVVADSTETINFKNKIIEYVSARLKNEDLSVNELALELALSERQLYRLAKSLTGQTPAQLIKEVRLQKAYEFLVAGKVYKIEDLANRVGYGNISYFSRQFLERFGKRPTEFL